MLSPLYGQLSPLRIPTRVTGREVQDSDTLAYIAAVESADAQTLEDAVKFAFEDFVVGCKSDGIWGAIKASCILAGARTLSGALVPLTGTAPTNYNFVSEDYNRVTGLKGNGSTKRLATGYAYPSALQNNCHAVAFQYGTDTGGVHFGAVDSSARGTFLVAENIKRSRHYQSGSSIFTPFNPSLTGFQGLTRSLASSYRYKSATGLQSANIPSEVITLPQFSIFARTSGSVINNYSPVRQSFYSLGEHLDLNLLDSRVSTLMTDLAAAIP